MSTTETLISALAGIQRGRQPEDLDNILRAVHEGFAEIRKTHLKNVNGTTSVRKYQLSLTYAGIALLEAME